MAFLIKEQKQIFGVTVNSLYGRVNPIVTIDGKLFTSVILYINKQAYKARQVLNHRFQVIERIEKYDEITGEPSGEFIEIPKLKDLSQEVVEVGTIENQSENYLLLTTEKLIDHLVNIKFITDRSNVVIDLD